MKLKELPYLLGYKAKPVSYSFEINQFELSEDGSVDYAQWLHPSESKKIITQENVDELRKFLKAGDVAIDIGAHSGDTTLPMALAVDKTGCVLALEPNRFVFPVLEKNSELNQEKTNIVALMFAATQEDGEFEFEYSDAGFCNGGRHEDISKWKHGHAFNLKVEGKNLHTFLMNNYPELISKIRFIKVDAEGFDYTILKSLKKLISKQKPYLKAEVFKHTSLAKREKLYQFIADFDYTIFRVEGDNNFCGEKIEKKDLNNWKHFDIFCIPS